MDWLAFALAILILLAPAAVYLAYARFLSGWDSSSWRWLILGLMAGGLLSVMAGTVEGTIRSALDLSLFAYVVVLAPLIEEPAKALWTLTGFARTKEPVRSEEAGLAAGIGFGVLEAAAYVALAYAAGGLLPAATVLIARSISGVSFHGSSAALEGLAVARGYRQFIPTIAVMMGLHALSNWCQIALPGAWGLAEAVALGTGLLLFSEWLLYRVRSTETKPEPGDG